MIDLSNGPEQACAQCLGSCGQAGPARATPGESSGFDGHDLEEAGPGLSTSTPVIVPPVPYAGNGRVHLAIGVVPDFFRGRPGVDIRIGWVLNCCGIIAPGMVLASSSA